MRVSSAVAVRRRWDLSLRFATGYSAIPPLRYGILRDPSASLRDTPRSLRFATGYSAIPPLRYGILRDPSASLRDTPRSLRLPLGMFRDVVPSAARETHE